MRVDVVFRPVPHGRSRSLSDQVADTLDDLASEPSSPADPATVLERIRRTEQVLTQLAVLQARDLVTLRRRRLAEQDAAHGEQAPAACVDPDAWVPSEVGMTLGLSEGQVRARLTYGAGLGRYSRVADLAEAGGVSAWTAQKLVDHLDTLAELVSPERLDAIEQSTVAWLQTRPRTVGQLNARMHRLIRTVQSERDQADGVTAEDRQARAHADRRVRLDSVGNGCAELWALLPEADALAIKAALDTAVTDPRSPAPSTPPPRTPATRTPDPRTRAQRRADRLVACLTGQPGQYGLSTDLPAGHPGAPVGTSIEVTVPLDTLTGAGQAPGEVPGYGLISSATAHALLDLPGASGTPQTRVSGLIVDPETGHCVGISPVGPVTWLADISDGTGYSHPPAMDAAIRARDRTCRAPGCRRPARREAGVPADLDHVVPWPEGPTSVDNSAALCRYHHRLKTHAVGWHVEGDGDGLTWRTPTGHTTTTRPHDYRELAEPGDDTPPF